MPDLVESFEIARPPAQVWAFFQDVPQVAACIPGFTLTGQTGESYRGMVKIRLGPVAGNFEGEASIVERDETAMTACIEGQGLDRQGGSRAAATVRYRLKPSGVGTRVEITAELKLSGALAQIGRTGMVQDVARELIASFAESLHARLAETAPAQADPAARAAGAPPAGALATAPPKELGVGFFWRVLRRRLATLFKRLCGCS